MNNAMKMSRMTLCLMISTSWVGIARAENNESAKASSGDRFLETSQTEQLHRDQTPVVAAAASHRAVPALSASHAAPLVGSPDIPAPEKDKNKAGSGNLVVGASLAGAVVGGAIGIIASAGNPLAMLAGIAVGGAAARGLVKLIADR